MRLAMVRLLSCTLLLMAAVATESFGVPRAYASCTPTRAAQSGDSFDGFTRNGNGTVGYPVKAKADILEYDSYVYASNQPSAWVMLAQGTLYAQAGWTEYGDGNGGHTRYTFEQHTVDNGAGWSETDAAGQPVNNTTAYEVDYQYGTTPLLYNYVNGSLFDTTATNMTGPTEALVSGEIPNLKDQMPGGSNAGAHEVFSSVQWFVHNAWYGLDAPTPGLNSDTNSDGFGQVKTSTTYYRIWDKTCSS
jgi:hypothetical protein